MDQEGVTLHVASGWTTNSRAEQGKCEVAKVTGGDAENGCN